MNVHEFQAKSLFSRYGIPVPMGKVVSTVEEAQEAVGTLDGGLFVVKAQIHAGGRGKAGGIKLTTKKEEVPILAGQLLGRPLVTHQTGPDGREVKKLLIEEGMEIEKEMYLSLLIDRSSGLPAFIVSSEGGVEIEEVAAHSPEKIIREFLDPAMGFQPFVGRKVGYQLGLSPEQIGSFVTLLGNLYRLLVEKGALLVEINPLVLAKDKGLVALDAKVSFDDNALFKHEEIKTLRDPDEEDPLEVSASQHGLNYVKLDGSIGCMVNGAGLAMATMDIIKLAGAWPANFLDVGGGASTESVKHAFQILLSDGNVKGVFVNIFGGIVRCERIAGGILEAAKEREIGVPVVVRLEGTNVEEGRRMLAESGLTIHVAQDLWEGAQTIARLVKGVE